MSDSRALPSRREVSAPDTWDLGSLFADDEQWEQSLRRFQNRIKRYESFRGKLADGPDELASCLKFDCQMEREAERLGTYAFLRTAEDQTDSQAQRMWGRFQNVATRASEAASYIRPEMMAIPAKRWPELLKSRKLKPYKLLIERLLRFKKHTLGKKEEALLAMQGEMASAPRQAFRQLLDSDLKFGTVRNERGEQVELSNATFSQFLLSPKRSVRRTAFEKYYAQFSAHENTLAATLNGSVQTDIYYARARGYPSALAAALFPDNVPQAVYDNLIETVHRHLPTVYRYYDLRRRKMKLRDIHHYDTYVPILSELKTRHTWNQAVTKVIAALQPLGDEYCRTLEQGLLGRWCDRFPNQGKQSGAFSCGTYDGDPYILMNYKEDVFDDVFTLAHEAGHSMHSFYSARRQPFQYYQYTIFVAEVASTFNEQLLSSYLLEHASDEAQRAYLINREIDAIRATLVRQTMFAEFEKQIHEMAEAGEPLTVQSLKDTYWKLLERYFGPDFCLDQALALECLRIPHFYRAFYVYKYATGLAAAVALSRLVREGGDAERDRYLRFLGAGCSKFPLDLLRDAGVDMASPEPIDATLNHLKTLVDQLDELL